MTEFHDKDIASLDLSDTDKNGLQVFRNYQKAFEKKSIELFVTESDILKFDIHILSDFLDLIVKVDIRFLPVIACSLDRKSTRLSHTDISRMPSSA